MPHITHLGCIMMEMFAPALRVSVLKYFTRRTTDLFMF